MKEVVLLSGGLDSRLAARLLQEQGIEVHAINFSTIFCTCTTKSKGCSEAVSAAREYKIPLKVYNNTKEIMKAVEHPKFGVGSGVNPCIDCRIIIFKRSKEYMTEIGAKFIVTGDVLGERPMSQRKDALRIIEKESGLEGLVLRPLSAKLLEPTIPEKKGWVNREKLLDIEGRSRKPQIKLARELGVNDYPCPAGGCLLTAKGFSKKIKDLIDYKEWTLENAMLLKHGRHFRISQNAKAIIGRDEEENAKLKYLKKESDYLFEMKEVPGPTSILRGNISNSDIDITSRLVAYFVKKKNKNNEVMIDISNKDITKTIKTSPFSEKEVSRYRINE